MRASAFLALSCLALGCGGNRPAATTTLEAATGDRAAVAAAADRYFAASTRAEMAGAVEAARNAGPETAGYHEIAGHFAMVEDRRADAIAHRIAALKDTGGDAPWLHLQQLGSHSFTLDERAAVEALLESIVRAHPDHAVRALAGRMLGGSLHLRGDAAGRAEALGHAGYRVPLAIVGTWDNDSGKGFDREAPPERGALSLDGRYPGQLLEVGWRREPPRNALGELDLDEMFTPDRWSFAYAAGGVELQADGDYELRLSTTDPVKVWVDGVLVFVARRVDAYLFDGFVVPLPLQKGAHRILVKTAHETGNWVLGVRLTGPGGAPLAPDMVAPAPGDGPVDPSHAAELAALGQQSGWPMTARALADARRPDGEGARADWMAVTMARLMGQRVLAVERAEAAAGRHAESLVLRYELAASLWDNGERARTSDLLTEVAEAAGPDLPYFGLQQARFWQQSDLKEKARARMQALRDAHPDRTSAWLRLAEAFRAESWEEDQCAALRAVLERTPNWPRVALDLGLCLEDLRFYPRAQAIYKEVRESLPNSHRALTRLHWHAQGNDEFVAAERYARELTRHWPHLQDSWLRLAETLRRAGDRAGAEAALESAIAIDPDDPVPHRRLAALAYQAGEVEPAVERWRAALERAPEDARLANRLAWLAPAAQGPWAADVPDEAALVEAVARRNTIAPLPGADVIYLLDDEVTRLNPDGSTINVVTMVAHAVNERGRDRLTRSSIRGGGRTRVLHAYAVDPDGRRLEASSIRGRSVRFRGLSVGSTVVLQYRLDARPDGYLDRYMARQWWFQAPGTQAAVSRWVVWAPAGTGFLDEGRGDYARTVDERGDLVRGEWRKDDNPPVITEPGMPTLSEVAAHVVVSTVPGWDLFWKWEEALLRDAFRVSPELRALAAELFEGTESASEKIRRLQTYLMTDIRYQQDYEGHIAGVKPHAAPMVVARQYGDCKDKAVLFITLARLGGVEAHYALVRTRDAGPVRRAVPMQQFNHAIVYVPAQGDFAEGRFMDPTVDALDVDVLRRDDQGVWALVHDPAGGTHEWRRIPFQDASVDWTRSTMALQLASDGSATLDIDLLAHGQVGAVLRTTARNPERLAQLMQKQMTQSFAGAQVLGHTPMELADVRTPARVQVAARAPNVARVEDDTLRLRAPISWRPEGWFALAERRHPLLLGVPRTLSWDVELGLPDGARLKRVPEDAKVSTTCLSLERAYSEEDGRLRVKQTVQFLCERIPVEQYGAHRAEVEAMTRVLDAEIVVTLGKRRGRATARR